jgi:hypothetical protein
MVKTTLGAALDGRAAQADHCNDRRRNHQDSIFSRLLHR